MEVHENDCSTLLRPDLKYEPEMQLMIKPESHFLVCVETVTAQPAQNVDNRTKQSAR
jgi:hypothetical protein